MALSYKTGTYTGNGTTAGNTLAVSGVGFTPKLIFVWSYQTGVGETGIYVTSTALMTGADRFLMMGDNGVPINQTAYDRFESIDADGFTVRYGSDYHALNKNGATYYYVCLGGDDVNSGSYTGNGSDNRNITGVGFEPVFALTAGGNDHHTFKLNSTGASTDAAQYLYNAANTSNTIQALQSDGFQVGTALSNTNGTVYYWFAIKGGDNIFNAYYTGNGSDNRDLTNIGLVPSFALIKSNAAATAIFRSDQMTGDLSKYRGGTSADCIQSFSSGAIQLGTDSTVNANGTTYQMFVIGEPVEQTSIKTINGNLLTLGCG